MSYDAGETELCEFESEAKASSENLAGFAHGSGRPFGCLLPGGGFTGRCCKVTCVRPLLMLGKSSGDA